jgi:N-acetylneuraminic acid mutarotase
VVDGKIYAIGGRSGGMALSDVEVYDPATDEWTEDYEEMPTPRALSLSTSEVGGRIYAIGGFDQGAGLSVVEVYDPVADEWARKADMPTGRRGLATSALRAKIYAIGGSLDGSPMLRGMLEVYDTGFVPQSVDAKGKAVTLWAKLKTLYLQQ